jgi:phospholipid-binding lipoprotein MlaA
MTRTRYGAILVLATLLAAAGVPTARAQEAANAEYDPLERVNRKVFWLNDTLDVYVLEPVATGWDRIAPEPVQRSISNFFYNVRFPIVAANDLLQGKVKATATDIARFMINTTFGVAGFFDLAGSWGLERHVEDFGQTLGYWGVPPGPYLVLPVLGPSNPRDTVGIAADAAIAIESYFINFYILLGARAVDGVNTRAQLLDQVRNAKSASLDYYGFVRNAYIQRRIALINDGTEVQGDTDSLYHLELDAE